MYASLTLPQPSHFIALLHSPAHLVQRYPSNDGTDDSTSGAHAIHTEPLSYLVALRPPLSVYEKTDVLSARNEFIPQVMVTLFTRQYGTASIERQLLHR